MTLVHYSIHFLWLRMYVRTYVHTSGMSDYWWVLMSLVDQTNGTETVHTLHLLHAHVYVCLRVCAALAYTKLHSCKCSVFHKAVNRHLCLCKDPFGPLHPA